jgi:hypothetical protein
LKNMCLGSRVREDGRRGSCRVYRIQMHLTVAADPGTSMNGLRCVFLVLESCNPHHSHVRSEAEK